MKLIAALALTLASSHAFAKSEGSLQCTSLRNSSGVYVTVKVGKAVFVGQNEAAISNITVTVSGGGAEAQGKARSLRADDDYAPKKYKDHSRFSLSKLTDVKTKKRFVPIDQCAFHWLVPNNGLRKASFYSPMVVNCDQSGGTITLKCDVTKTISSS